MAAAHGAAAAALLHRQATTLHEHRRADYLAGWADTTAARNLSRTSYADLTRLGVSTITPRLSLPSVRERGSAWTARVDVSWRPVGSSDATATAILRYTFTEVDGSVLILDVRPVAGARTPIWLLPGLEVGHGPRTLVAATDADAGDRVSRLLAQAVTAVGRVLPAWRGDLVAFVPGTPAEFDALLAAEPGDYRGIAAVTTTVDGSREQGAPTAIVVNPVVFRGLGPIGAHVVIAHEATHVATGAAETSMPLWVVEGFADYVGIGSVRLPVSVAAKAALSDVRRSGPPPTLPTDAEFTGGGPALEATYEQAWLASSLIARTYGQQRLVAFYRALQRDPDGMAAVFPRVLHTSLAEFTATWRGTLVRTADAG